MTASRLRNWLRPLRATPLHPQWFVFRDEIRVHDWLRDRASGRVLDIGCADGWARNLLIDCDYVGLDYPTTATGLYGTRPQVFADGAHLPFASSSFDTVLLLEVLEHVTDAESVLAEICRVLKPEGRLLISVPFLYPLHDAPHDYRRYTAPGMAQALARAGLNPTAIVPRNGGFEAAALLAAIACAESVILSIQARTWRVIFAPILVLAIPLVNMLGWIFAALGPGKILASGHRAEASKPQDDPSSYL